jgi:transcriptional regulator with PAS, ATPase and Fis domain
MLPPDMISSLPPPVSYDTGNLKSRIEHYEREIFANAYAVHKTSIAVGKALGISQATAARRLRKYVPGYVGEPNR